MARGTGGRSELARQLDISPSNLSKIFARKAGFDQKTVNLLALIRSSEATLYQGVPIMAETAIHGLIVEKRNDGKGEPFYTWRSA